MVVEVFPAPVELSVIDGTSFLEHALVKLLQFLFPLEPPITDGALPSEETDALVDSKEGDAQVVSEKTDALEASVQTKAVAKRFRPRLPVILYGLKTSSRLKVVREAHRGSGMRYIASFGYSLKLQINFNITAKGREEYRQKKCNKCGFHALDGEWCIYDLLPTKSLSESSFSDAD